MVQWFKNIFSFFRSKQEAKLSIEGIDLKSLSNDLSHAWQSLFDCRRDEAFAVMLAQLKRVKTIYLLKAANLPATQNLAVEFAKQQGRVDGLNEFISLVEEQMSQMEIKQRTRGDVKQGESKMTYRKRKSKPMSAAIY